MANSEDKYKVPLFDDNNYHSWKFRMEILLDEQDLLNYVQQPLKLENVPSTETEVPEINRRNNQIIKDDKACKRRIVSKVADSHLEYLQGKETAYDMWENLRRGFERQSLATQNRVKRQIETFRKKSTVNLSEHFLQFDQLIREYKSAGGEISERECVLQLFQSVSSNEYQTVISSLETLSLADESLITLAYVKGRLLDEEAKLSRMMTKTKEENHSSAVFMTKSGKNFKRAK